MPTPEEIEAAKKADEEKRAKELQTFVHSAVATHLKDLKTKLSEETRAALAELVSPTALGEIIKPLFGEFAKTITPAPGADPPKDPKTFDVSKAPEFVALQRRLDEADKVRVEQEKRANAAEKKQRDDSAIASIRSGFGQKVRPELLDTLVAAQWASGRFKHDDKGQLLMTVRRAPLSGMEEVDQDLPLKDGMDHWLKSKDAEPFLPPPTGQVQKQRAPGRVVTQPRRYDTPATTASEKNARAMEREAELATQFPNLAR